MFAFFHKNLINLIFILALAALVIIGIFIYQQMQKSVISNKWVVHTYQVIEEVKQEESDLIRIQSQINYYLISGNTQILYSLPIIEQSAEKNIQQLRFLVHDNPTQLHRLDELEILKNERIDLTQKIIEAYSNRDQSQVHMLATQKSREERAYKISKLLNEITQQELSLLNQRTDAYNRSVKNTNELFITLGSISIFSLIFTFLMLNYNLRLRIKQSQQLEEASHLKSKFLANMSHELRTPLNSIIGFAEIMYNENTSTPSTQYKEFLGDILSSSRHLLQLINDVLDVAKIESGKMEFYPERIQIKELLNEVTTNLQNFINTKQIHFFVNIQPTLIEVTIDPARFKQILYNLASNALKFTPEGGSVEINIYSLNNTYFRVEVKDTGIGIKEEDMKKLFTEFQQIDSSISKKYAGTGLGLVLVKRIAEAQGGEVGFTSTLGKGSSFYVILPKKPIKIQN